ncbi:aldolase/citrate lyase family protein [Corynebacterium uberis]|uniref:aldolase/citrate lyase family protein n=1 Tax=Corynebacterium TaxID=1716 RepID=UPI001D0BBEBE|nr:aldolase/citrate lyase family protein [Corynebacterium uberis]MCZ9310044.1 aldolase/citrate lyase family protein [Corynebacterium sp. c6VSa_13]UDL73792.1 2-dehydro-3-deoxyglucarate aldolase [Corynebacterium uberis]UDL75325.1 2-dehydro-3-deoxyglucarate aldolase [Corynebacterium uberis]UDL79823.1 2-dehydro-3-deoxyglucarate aldolase [Corynebacterium uberis]UDL81954.1 2-dehydro-3-deoxyglucarate aldolase [Corynebacterium uberis]
MPLPVSLPPTFASALAGPDPLIGLWASAGSAATAEIVAAAADWVLIDAEHSPYDLSTVTDLLRAVSAYPAIPVVRVPTCDTVVIKRFLDLGAQNLMVPMVHSPSIAQEAVAAMHYPPRGVRGVGSALARSSRWNAVPDYLARASETLSLTVQIESPEAVAAAADIARVDGVDAVFIGPSDLAATMGHLGNPQHPDVRAAVAQAIAAVRATGTPVGVNSFDLAAARGYLEAGATFVNIGADVQLLAQAVRAAVSQF